MTLSSLRSLIADMGDRGITVWLHVEPARVRVVMQNKNYKLAKAELSWAEAEDGLPGTISHLADALAA
ncbi:MAG: hypothetical protein ACEQSB_06180 [Undibacterium sp.]